MKKQDIDTNNVGQIAELFSNNLLNRNKNLFTLLNFINGIEGQMILNLDGAWGSGKSVFLKQIEYLSTTTDNIQYINPHEKNIVDKFKEDYYTFYFNSWEHDLYNNPLESLISEMLMKIASEYDLENEKGNIKDDIRETLKKVGGKLLSRGVKNISGGFIELEDFTEQNKDFTPKITSINTQKQAITDLIQKLSDITNKRLLIIVDELDRCKPSYAVELLEIVKHFFTHDDVVFLFGTNKNELEHTIKTLYGQGFNGYKYLNRFFDFEFNLPEIDKENFIKHKFESSVTPFAKETIKYCLNYFDFSMRDINRYCSIFDILTKTENGFFDMRIFFIDNVLIPYAISLKISSGVEYTKFIDGYGEESLMSFYKNIPSKVKERFNLSTDENIDILAKEVYSLVNKIRTKNTVGLNDFEGLEYKLETLTMLSD